MRALLRRLSGEERGMTIVEVMVAALLLVTGALATFTVVDAATRNTYRAQQSQVLDNRLQNEIEQLRKLGYESQALTAVPVHSDDSSNPNNRVTGTTFNLAKTGAANPAALVYNGGALEGGGTVEDGEIDPGPTPYTSGSVSGNIYRYVVWQNDPSCPEAQCPGQQDYKVLVVAATLSTTPSGGARAYQEIHSAVPNPELSVACPEGGCPSAGGPSTTPWTFWLTDTPCVTDTRQPIAVVGGTDGHPTHNTRGVCNQGMQNGDNPGAPDLMYVQPAPLDNNYSSDQQPLYDYSTDVEPTVNPDADKGLQIKNGPGCGSLQSTWGTLPLVSDTFDPTYFQQVHKWLTPAILNGYSILFNGRGALNLWTKSINGDVGPGRICVFIFLRQVSLDPFGTPVYTDTPVINLDLNNLTYSPHSQDPWPTGWTELHVPLHFDLGVNVPLQLDPGDRLGLAISVDGGATGASGLQIHYDHPSFDSRLELETSSVLPPF